MAFRVLRAFGVFPNCLKTSVVTQCETRPYPHIFVNGLLNINSPLFVVKRDTSFFQSLPADELWKGITSVSNAGRKRGRAKGLKKKKNLNRGQVIGVGKVNVSFPGLNKRVDETEIKREIWTPRSISEGKPIHLQHLRSKKLKLSPIERGWTGGHVGGRKIGPPTAEDGTELQGFESWILGSKLVTTQSGMYGRVRNVRSIVVTGNGKGLVGFAVATCPSQGASFNAAKRKAGNRLIYIERHNDHTVLHDFVGQFDNTKVIVQRAPQSYGLVCHRVINVICQAIGIKDIYAKVEGAMNVRSIIKAFFIGLLQQKSFQEMAEEKKLHVVEFKKENANYPVVVASPSVVRKAEEIEPTELIDFKQYLLDGKILLPRKPYVPFYTRLPSYQKHVKKKERMRGHDNVRLKLLVDYGEVRSFLTEKYPECSLPSKKIKKAEEA